MTEARIQALYEQSEALARQGRHSEAIEALHEAQSLDPDSEQTQQRLSDLQREMLDAQIDAILDDAREHLDAGDDTAAQARLLEAEQLDATRVDTIELLAEVSQRDNRRLADQRLNEAWELCERGSGSEAMIKIEEARRLAPDMPGINDRILKIRRSHLEHEVHRLQDDAERMAKGGHLMGAADKLRQAQRLIPQNPQTQRRLREIEAQLAGDDVDQMLAQVRELIEQLKFASARQIMLEAAKIDPERAEVVRTARVLRKAILKAKAEEVKRRVADERQQGSEAGPGDQTDQVGVDPTDGVEWGGGQPTAVGGFDFGQGTDQHRRASNDSTIALVGGGTGQIQFDAEDLEGPPEDSGDFGFFDQDDASINLDGEKGGKEQMIQLPPESLIEEGDTADAADAADDSEMVELPPSSLVSDGDEDDIQVAELADDEPTAQFPADALVIDDDLDSPGAGDASRAETAGALAELDAELASELSGEDDDEQIAQLLPEHLVEEPPDQRRAQQRRARESSDADAVEASLDDGDDDDIELARYESSVDEPGLRDDGERISPDAATDDLDPSVLADEQLNQLEAATREAAGIFGDARMNRSETDTEDSELQAADHGRAPRGRGTTLGAAAGGARNNDDAFADDQDDDDDELRVIDDRKKPPEFRLVDEDELRLGGEDELRLSDEEGLSYGQSDSGSNVFPAETADGSSAAMDAQGADADEPEPLTFGYYWGVTSEFSVPMGHPLPYGMEDSIDTESLPLRRDVAVFYPSVFGEFPELGLHQLFYKKSGYATWRSAFQGWMQRHQQKLTSVLRKMFPEGRTHGIHYGVIAKGNWHIALEMTPNQKSRQTDPLANDMDFESDWEEFIRALNDEAWDVTFLKEIQFNPPKGCSNFKELRRSDNPAWKNARKKLLTGSWDHFARLYFLRTLLVCRHLCPNIRWGLMGYPATAYMAYMPDSRNLGMFREINDRLQWLWEAEDVILPMFSATRRTVPQGESADADQKENSFDADVQNIRTSILEVARIRERYAPDTPIVSVHSLEYSKVAGGGQLEQTNFENQFLLPRACGVDGIMVTGHVTSDIQLDMLAEELSGRLGQAIRAAAEADGGFDIDADLRSRPDDEDDD